MQGIVTYLNFDGNCKEAMTFYGKCLGAELFLMPFEDVADRIMHARLSKRHNLPSDGVRHDARDASHTGQQLLGQRPL